MLSWQSGPRQAGWWEERAVHRRWQQGRLLCSKPKKVDELNQHWTFSSPPEPLLALQSQIEGFVIENETEWESCATKRDLLSSVHATICMRGIHC